MKWTLPKIFRTDDGVAINPEQEIHGHWRQRLRMAVIGPWFNVKGSARVFKHISVSALNRYRAEAVAGPVTTLKSLAEQILADGTPLDSLQYGVIAFTGNGCPALVEADKDLLWRAFQVPVFEQYRGPEGQLLATECEAHQGLHISSLCDTLYRISKLATELGATIESAPLQLWGLFPSTD